MNNSYTRRKVATKDQKPCLICSKPTTTVLYNQSGPDWLYTCDLHLEDNPHFVTRIYSEAYTSTLRELEGVRRELDRLEGTGRSGHGSGASWDVWVSKIFDSKKSATSDTTTTTTTTTTNTQASSPPPPPTTDNTATATATTATAQTSSLQQRYNVLLDRLAELRRQERGHRNYKLSDQMFEYRLLRRQQQLKQLAKRRQEAANYSNTDPDELAAKFQFPEVPKGK